MMMADKKNNFFFNTHRFLVEMKSYNSTVSIIRKMENFVNEIFHIRVTLVILKEIAFNGSLQCIFKNN